MQNVPYITPPFGVETPETAQAEVDLAQRIVNSNEDYCTFKVPEGWGGAKSYLTIKWLIVGGILVGSIWLGALWVYNYQHGNRLKEITASLRDGSFIVETLAIAALPTFAILYMQQRRTGDINWVDAMVIFIKFAALSLLFEYSGFYAAFFPTRRQCLIAPTEPSQKVMNDRKAEIFFTSVVAVIFATFVILGIVKSSPTPKSKQQVSATLSPLQQREVAVVAGEPTFSIPP